MPAVPPPFAPQLVSLRTIAAAGGATFDWHSHPFDEFTLVTDDACLIGYPPGWRETAPNTLLHYRAGERHGAWTSPKQRPRFWVVHFTADANVYGALDHFRSDDPTRRVWAITPEQNDTFQWIFLQLLNEHTAPRAHRESAASAWLQLLLITVQRWASSNEATITLPSRANAEVLRLWHRINAAVAKPNDELDELYSAPNYDSVRHAFRKAFGCSPREMLQRLRMEHAKNLLLESSLSIKEISTRVGYVAQHDFNRMFHRHTGMAPSKWRANPLARVPAPTK
ncbi:MAG: helix-turn-helix domain-containing protein [Opitutaceae bacterium]|nr:helix-turn-helix domain-containing protein [Opitutaceae bacterium]